MKKLFKLGFAALVGVFGLMSFAHAEGEGEGEQQGEQTQIIEFDFMTTPGIAPVIEEANTINFSLFYGIRPSMGDIDFSKRVAKGGVADYTVTAAFFRGETYVGTFNVPVSEDFGVEDYDDNGFVEYDFYSSDLEAADLAKFTDGQYNVICYLLDGADTVKVTVDGVQVNASCNASFQLGSEEEEPEFPGDPSGLSASLVDGQYSLTWTGDAVGAYVAEVYQAGSGENGANTTLWKSTPVVHYEGSSETSYSTTWNYGAFVGTAKWRVWPVVVTDENGEEKVAEGTAVVSTNDITITAWQAPEVTLTNVEVGKTPAESAEDVDQLWVKFTHTPTTATIQVFIYAPASKAGDPEPIAKVSSYEGVAEWTYGCNFCDKAVPAGDYTWKYRVVDANSFGDVDYLRAGALTDAPTSLATITITEAFTPEGSETDETPTFLDAQPNADGSVISFTWSTQASSVVLTIKEGENTVKTETVNGSMYNWTLTEEQKGKNYTWQVCAGEKCSETKTLNLGAGSTDNVTIGVYDPKGAVDLANDNDPDPENALGPQVNFEKGDAINFTVTCSETIEDWYDNGKAFSVTIYNEEGQDVHQKYIYTGTYNYGDNEGEDKLADGKYKFEVVYCTFTDLEHHDPQSYTDITSTKFTFWATVGAAEEEDGLTIAVQVGENTLPWNESRFDVVGTFPATANEDGIKVGNIDLTLYATQIDEEHQFEVEAVLYGSLIDVETTPSYFYLNAQAVDEDNDYFYLPVQLKDMAPGLYQINVTWVNKLHDAYLTAGGNKQTIALLVRVGEEAEGDPVVMMVNPAPNFEGLSFGTFNTLTPKFTVSVNGGGAVLGTNANLHVDIEKEPSYEEDGRVQEGAIFDTVIESTEFGIPEGLLQDGGRYRVTFTLYHKVVDENKVDSTWLNALGNNIGNHCDFAINVNGVEVKTPSKATAVANNETVTFTIENADAAYRYEFLINDATGSENGRRYISESGDSVKDGKLVVSYDFNVGKYVWQVRSVKDAFKSDWVDGNDFEVTLADADIEAMKPAELASKVEKGKVTFSWKSVEKCNYTLTIYNKLEVEEEAPVATQADAEEAETEPNNSNLKFYKEYKNANSPFVWDEEILPGNYVWSIVAERAGITSDEIFGEAFTVEEGAANEVAEMAGVNVYPNPNNGVFNVVVPVKANVDIFAANGMLVVREAQVNGLRQYNLNRSGIYFVRVSNGLQTAVKRVVVR